MFEKFGSWIAGQIAAYGYGAIIIAMAIESTFIPLPSELIIIPAGYLWYIGKLNPFLIVIGAVIGSLIGSYFTYWLGEAYGRDFVLKHSKYFFIKEKHLQKVDLFFEKYGSWSIFLGRLVLGIRHYISFPAGIAKMNKTKFLIYTALGAGIWSTFLMYLGYFIGDNIDLIKEYTTYFTIAVVIIIVLAILYIFQEEIFSKLKRKKK